MVLESAGPAEIFRAHQKDEMICQAIKSQLTDVLQRVLANKLFFTSNKWLPAVSEILYYSLTTMSNLQSLGEEYTGIIMVDVTKRQIPSKMKRLTMILLYCSGWYFVDKLIKTMLVYLKNNHQLDLEELHPITTRRLLTLIEKIHAAIFYQNGKFLNISKRLTGIHYVLHHYWIREKSKDTLFRGLAIITSIHCVLALYKLYEELSVILPKFPEKMVHNAKSTNNYAPQTCCSLCLEEISDPSSTPCGHIFCWKCILEWLQAEERCPICKEVAKPHRIIPLQNYS